MSRRATRRKEAGQGSIEYVAILAIIALIVSVLGLDPAGDIDDEFEDEVCRIITGGQSDQCDRDGDGVPDGQDDDDGDGDGDGDQPQRPPAEPINRDRWNQIPCPVARDGSFRGFDLFLPRFIVGANSASESIEQVGPDRFRVTIVGEGRAGVGVFTGDPPGTRTQGGDRRPATGFNGLGAITIGGRTASTYEFGSREEAERYLEERRGGWRGYAAGLTGVNGNMVETLWRDGRRLAGDLWDRANGREPEPNPEPLPRFYTMGVNARASMAAGWNQGRVGGVEGDLSGTFDEALTLDMGDRLTPPQSEDPRRLIHTVSAEGGVLGQLFPPQPVGIGRVPIPAAGGQYGGDKAYRYRYITDNQGNPLRLILIEETSRNIGISVRSGVTGQNRRSGIYRGGNIAPEGRVTETTVREVHLDLTVPENRRAFDQVFLTQGPLAHPQWNALTDQRRLEQFQQRVAADGLIAEFRHEGMSGEINIGWAASAGRYSRQLGIFPKAGASSRDLVEARYVDMRQDDPQWAPLRSCTEPSTGDLSGSTPSTGGSGNRPPGTP
jgi:hypothetical protein